MAEVIGVRFKNTGKVYYFDPQGIQVEKGSMAIVETARPKSIHQNEKEKGHSPCAEGK